MKRRHVLLSGIGALCAAVAFRLALTHDESAILKVIRKRLAYLRLDEAGVQRFARDLKTRHMVSSPRLRMLDAAGPLYSDFALTAHDELNDALHHGEDRIVTQYLISTDFFIFGADETRTVQYLGYYDPMIACNNPFARTMLGPPPTYPRATT